MFVDRLDIVRAALVGALAGVLCDLAFGIDLELITTTVASPDTKV